MTDRSILLVEDNPDDEARVLRTLGVFWLQLNESAPESTSASD
jgi:hypothetical protein